MHSKLEFFYSSGKMGAQQSGPDHSLYTNDQTVLPEQPTQLLSTAFIAKYSIRFPESMPPQSRSKHFTVFFPKSDIAIIGYGLNMNGENLNDIWMINFTTQTWQKLDIDTSSIMARSGATAVAVDNKLYVFGGLANSQYFADLHIIDLESMTIIRPRQRSGSYLSPPGRISHAMGYADGKIVIWGGFNGTFLKDLWVYDIETNEWTGKPSDAHGRADAAFATLDKTLYIVGSSKSDAVLSFDIPNGNKMNITTPTGNPPQYDLKGALMVPVGRYLIFIGGKLENKRYGLVRAYDTIKCWWFVIFVAPDGETTTMFDGKIDPNGMFMLPRTYDGSLIYRQMKREVIGFLGQPIVTPPVLNVIELGEALAYLNITGDMKDMLYLQ